MLLYCRLVRKVTINIWKVDLHFPSYFASGMLWQVTLNNVVHTARVVWWRGASLTEHPLLHVVHFVIPDAKVHRFWRPNHWNAQHHVVADLGSLPSAHCSTVHHILAHVRQDLLGLGKIWVLASYHECQDGISGSIHTWQKTKTAMIYIPRAFTGSVPHATNVRKIKLFHAAISNSRPTKVPKQEYLKTHHELPHYLRATTCSCTAFKKLTLYLL